MDSEFPRELGLYLTNLVHKVRDAKGIIEISTKHRMVGALLEVVQESMKAQLDSVSTDRPAVWCAMQELVIWYFAALRQRQLSILVFHEAVFSEVYGELVTLLEKPEAEMTAGEMMSSLLFGPAHERALPLVQNMLRDLTT